MRDHPSRARIDAARVSALLPAEDATLSTFLSGRLVLVAHTGNAHLGIPVDRALLRDVTRAQAFLDDGEAVPEVVLPEAVAFRQATSHSLDMSGGHVFLTLHAIGDPVESDVHVELRMKPPLVRRLVRHHDRRQRRRLLAVTAFLTVIGVVVTVLGVLAQ